MPRADGLKHDSFPLHSTAGLHGCPSHLLDNFLDGHAHDGQVGLEGGGAEGGELGPVEIHGQGGLHGGL